MKRNTSEGIHPFSSLSNLGESGSDGDIYQQSYYRTIVINISAVLFLLDLLSHYRAFPRKTLSFGEWCWLGRINSRRINFIACLKVHIGQIGVNMVVPDRAGTRRLGFSISESR